MMGLWGGGEEPTAFQKLSGSRGAGVRCRFWKRILEGEHKRSTHFTKLLSSLETTNYIKLLNVHKKQGWVLAFFLLRTQGMEVQHTQETEGVIGCVQPHPASLGKKKKTKKQKRRIL